MSEERRKIMQYKYKFVDGNCKTIYKVNRFEKIIPYKNQKVVVRNKEYSVFRVDETINFDAFTTEITIYLNNLE